MNSVAIVGGGITGLVAAYRLQQLGFSPVVYEASPRLGGVIQSVRKDGYLAECGPNTILETSQKIGEVIRDLGLESTKLYTAPEAEARFIVRGRKLVVVPSSPVKFFTSELFSLGAKAHLLVEPFVTRAPASEEENLEHFVVRRLGREFLDYAINPLVAGIYAGNPARLSVKEAFPKLHAVEQKYGSLILGQFLGARERKRRGEISKQNAKKFSFVNGLQELIDRLGEMLKDRIELNSKVQVIEQEGDGWLVKREVNGGTVVTRHHAVLLAAPAHALSGLDIRAKAAVTLETLGEINYPPVTSVVFGFRREDVMHPLTGFGALVPEVEKLSILGVIFSSSLFPNRAPAGHVTLTCYLGGERNPRLGRAARATLRELVLKDLKVLLNVTGQPTFEHYFSFKKAIPAPWLKVEVLPPYYNDPDYIEALVGSAQPYLEGEYDHLLFSYHGVPERHIRNSDPTGSHCLKTPNCCEIPSPAHATCYRAQCFQTTKLFVERAGIPKSMYSIAFQSRLGRDPWLTPFTDKELERLAKGGVKKLRVICPAFVSDCLETIEEIGERGRESFLRNGGTEFTMIPCLNEHPLWIAALEKKINAFASKGEAAPLAA